MPQGISRRELARRRGVDEKAIRLHIASGLLAPALMPDGSLDPYEANRLLDDNLTQGPQVADDVALAKARLLRATTALLQDDITRLRASLVEVADWQAFLRREGAFIAGCCRAVPEALAPAVAGLSPQDALPILRAAVRDLLEALSQEGDAGDDVGEDDEVDVESLTPAEVEALRNNLQAEERELKRAKRRGEVVLLEDASIEWGQRCSVVKSILTSLPGDPALNFEGRTLAETQTLLAEAMERALEPLGLEEPVAA